MISTTSGTLDPARVMAAAERLDARANDIASRLATEFAPTAKDPTLVTEMDETRKLARRLRLAAFVIDADDVVTQMRAQAELLVAAYDQVMTGHLINDPDRDRVDAVIGGAIEFARHHAEHWPLLVARAHDLAAGAA